MELQENCRVTVCHGGIVLPPPPTPHATEVFHAFHLKFVITMASKKGTRTAVTSAVQFQNIDVLHNTSILRVA